MFKKTRQKIFLVLFAIPSIIATFLGVFIATCFCIYTNDDFKSSLISTARITSTFYKAEKERLLLNIDRLLDSVEMFNYLTSATDENVIQNKLNDLTNSNDVILGCYLYSDNGNLKTNQISNIPGKEDLLENPKLSNYMSSGINTPLITIRTENIPTSYYFGSNYIASNGVFSIFKKKNNALLVIDFDTHVLYEEIFNFKNYQNYQNNQVVIYYKDSDNLNIPLIRESNKDLQIDYSISKELTRTKKNYIVTQNVDTDLLMYVTIPTSNSTNIISNIIGYTALAVILFNLSLLIISLLYSYHKAKRLEAINQKIKDQHYQS